jgi:hypothetical protein
VKVNYTKALPVAFGDYCQVLERVSDNSMKPRTYSAIALLPTGSEQGSVRFWNVATGGVSTSAQFKVLPFPQEGIEYMKRLAKACPPDSKDISRDDIMFQAFDDDDTVDLGGDEHDAVVELYEGERKELVVNPPQSDDDIDDEELVAEETTGNPQPDDPPDDPQVEPENADETAIQHEVVEEELPAPLATSRRERMRATRDSMIDTTAREHKSYHTLNNYILNMKIEEAMKVKPQEAEQSILKELRSIHDKGTFKPIHIRDLSYQQRKSIIPSKLFLKDKYSPDGTFEKLKSRLVGGGHRQDRTLYEDHERSSPTLSTTGLFTIAGIAAKRGWDRATADIGTAYLNAKLKDKHEIYMKIAPKLSSILCKIDPKYQEYQCEDGSIVVQLLRALYGLVESSVLWYDELSCSLKENGYAVNQFERCVFTKEERGEIVSIVGVFVDDLLILSKNDGYIQELYGNLLSKYEDVKINRDLKLKYLGMIFDYSVPEEVSITMPSFVEDLLKNAAPGIAKTPAAADLYEVGESELLSHDEKIAFHSDTAKLLYMAKRTRPDLLFALSYLTTRVKEPTKRDQEKLNRVFKYVRHTSDLALRMAFNRNNQLSYLTYIDSSHGIHQDMRGHSGVCVTFGGACILAKSTKHKINSKSSAESELIALSDHAGIAIHGQRFLKSLKIDSPCIIYQDNTSTKDMITNLNVNDKSKHIKIRYYWLKERVREGEVMIMYIPTEQMLADLMTKAVQGILFVKLRDEVMNNPNQEGCVGK